MLKFDSKGRPVKTESKTENKTTSKKNVESEFTKRLGKALNVKEVELDDGTVISNMDAIIDSLISKAISGDKESIRLIKELS